MPIGPRVGGAHVSVNMRMNPKSIDLVAGQIHRQLARLGERNRAVYQAIGRDTVIAWRTALGAVLTGAPLMGSAISAVGGAATMLAGALYSTVQSSFSLLTLLGSVAIAAGTAKIGFEGFGDAINAANPEELAAALERLSPSAQESALAVRGLKDAWGQLQQTVQENLFANLSGEISKLSTTLIPVLESGLGQMATSLNGLADSVLKYVNSRAGLEQINTALEGSVGIFDRLRGAAVPFLDGFLRLYNALIPAGERLADRITDIAERFQSWTQAEGFGERINDMMLRAEKTAGLLFDVLGNLGGAISNIFNAGNAETNSFLQYLVDVTQKFQDWTASAEGQNSIVEWLRGANDSIRAFGDAMGPVFDVLSRLTDPRVFQSFVETVGIAFEHLGRLPLEAIVDGFVRIAEAIQPISGVLLAVIAAAASFNIIIGTLVGQLGGVFSLFARAAGVFGRLTTWFSTAAAAGGGLSGVFSSVLSVLGRFAKFAGPIGIAVWIGTIIARSDELKAKLGEVWESLGGVGEAISGAFEQVSTAAAPIVSALEPVFTVIDNIAKIAIGVVLDQMILGFTNLATVISGLGQFISGFITVLTGLFTLDFSQVTTGLSEMFSGIGTVIQGVIDQITGFLAPEALRTLATQAFTGISDGITVAIPLIQAGISTLIANILTFFSELPGQLLSLATSAFSSIVDGVMSATPGILAAVGNIVTGILEFFITLPLQLAALAMNAFAAVLEAVAAHGPGIIEGAGNIVTGVIDWFVGLPGELLALGTAAFVAVLNAVQTNGPAIIQGAGNIVTGVINFFVDLPATLLGLAASAFASVHSAVTSAGPGILSAVSGIASGIVSFFTALPGQLFAIGASMISSLSSGILSQLESVTAAASRIVSAVKGFFPGSPVKTGPLKSWNRGSDATGAGEDLIKALTKGLSNVNPIRDAMREVAQAVASGIPQSQVRTAAVRTTPVSGNVTPAPIIDYDRLAAAIERAVYSGSARGTSEGMSGLASRARMHAPVGVRG